MRTLTLVATMLVAGAGCLEGQATASPSSRVAPRAPARGIRTEPPKAPEPGQPAQPPAESRPAVPVVVTGAAPYYYYYAYGPYAYGTVGGGAYFESEATYAQQAPPPSHIDVRGPQPGPAMAWLPGFWSWTGSSYNWNEGRWVPIPAGYTRWVPGRWVQNQFGWYFVRGYWEP